MFCNAVPKLRRATEQKFGYFAALVLSEQSEFLELLGHCMSTGWSDAFRLHMPGGPKDTAPHMEWIFKNHVHHD